ncbi:MAG: rhodanese-like domain-containing protein [Magnetococcales bacterium]|nr:rhodanese-like domain-containing protein [Magnetococcales bacterium]
MQWLAENSLLLLGILFLLTMTLKGPMMARAYGIRSITVHDLAKLLAESNPPLLLDVRTLPEFNGGHVKQAVSVPLWEVRKRLDHLRQEGEGRPVVVICRSGNRSLQGAVALKRAGFQEVINVVGGMANWEAQGYPIKK